MGSTNIPDRLQQLLDQQYWTEEEHLWILQYLDTSDHAELKRLMQEKFDNNSTINQPDTKAENLLSLIHAKIDAAESTDRPVIINMWKRIMVAAAVLFVISMGVVTYINHTPNKNEAIAAKNRLPVQHDIAPGYDNAILTLSDSSTIMLSSAVNGKIAQQGNINVFKQNGKVTYSGKAGLEHELIYNKVSTSRGNQYQLLLADGSSVWLNAASSIRFPAAFNSKERRVEITGEAYFEVASLYTKGKQKVPFIVKVKTASNKGYDVQVLGTHFNINAYDDESTVRTTLAEGKVKVVKGSQSVLLQSLQQAVLNKENEGLDIFSADVEEAIAWKNGMFEFHDTNLHSIMRQITRWYNVEVRFSDSVSDKLYTGTIRRQASLSQVLKILKLAGVSYSLNDHIVTIETN